MNAMLKKEVRDAVRWMPIGLVLMALMIAFIGKQPNFFERYSSELFFVTWVVAASFGLFLSLATFLREEKEAARAFLVHRGLSLDRIYRLRVWVGLTVYAVTLLLPIGLVAAYFTVIGNEQFPISPRQTIPACFAVFYCSGFYFAGVIISCRGCRWIGTRLLPLGLAFLVAASSGAVFTFFTNLGFWIVVPLGLGLVGLTLLALGSRHAFMAMPAEVSPARHRRLNWPLSLGLLVSSVFLVSALALTPINLLSLVNTYPQIVFSPQGVPWITVRQNIPPYSDARPPVPMINESSATSSTTELKDPLPGSTFVSIHRNAETWDYYRFIDVGHDTGYYSPDGYIYIYSRMPTGSSSQLTNIVSSDRVSKPGEPLGTPFAACPLDFSHFTIENNQVGSMYLTQLSRLRRPWLTLADKSGFLRVDLEKQTIDRLIEKKIDMVSYLLTTEKNLSEKANSNPPRIILRSGNELSVYRLAFGNATEGLDPVVAHGKIDFEFENTIQLPKSPSMWASFLYKDSQNWTLVDSETPGVTWASKNTVTRSVEGKTSTFDFVVPENIAQIQDAQVHRESPFVCLSIPPVLTSAALLFGPIPRSASLFIVMQIVVATFLTWVSCSTRRLSSRSTLAWVAASALLGLGTWVAVLAIYPQLYFASCCNCRKNRRVELDRCEHCNAEWETPKQEGIEILDTDPPFGQVTTESRGDGIVLA